MLPSGLSHPKFGMKALQGHLKSIDRGTELGPVALVQSFANLVGDRENLREFRAFKQMLPKVRLSDLDNVESSGAEPKLELSMVLPPDPIEVLRPLKSEALRRAKFYTLASGVVKREKRWVFVIVLKEENRALRKSRKPI